MQAEGLDLKGRERKRRRRNTEWVWVDGKGLKSSFAGIDEGYGHSGVVKRFLVRRCRRCRIWLDVL